VKIKTRNKKISLQNLKEITLSTHTPATVLEDSLVARGCEYLLPYLPGNGARKALDVYERLMTHKYRGSQ
jgi:hypothetical protein